MTNAKPLSWCVDWVHLKPVEQLMMWFPLIGTQRRIYADLKNQLRERTAADTAAWLKCGSEVRALAQTISGILIEHLGWPQTSVFLPDDPADIPFWDKTGDLAAVGAMFAIERTLQVKVPEEFITRLPRITFGEAVAELGRMRAEPGASPNGGPAERLGNSGAGGGPPSVS